MKENKLTGQDAQPVRIHRWNDGEWGGADDVIAEEVFIRVLINGTVYGSLVCSPWELEELVAGYLCSDGVISSRRDLLELRVEGSDVLVTLAAPVGQRRGRRELPERVTPLPRPLVAEDVLRLASSLENGSHLFHRTGGVHNAALSDGKEILTNCEDVGRHNAFDRLIGRCLLQGIPMAGRVIVFSGRVPDEIIRKVVCTGCGAIISVSAPTSLAVRTARSAGVLLVGFARGRRFNVYSHPEFIKP